jgi:hypothetical protein
VQTRRLTIRLDRCNVCDGEEKSLSKTGLLALSALVFFAGVACADDQIALTCSGTMVAAGTKNTAPNQSLVIDLDRGIVKIGSIGELSITKLTENAVSFEAKSPDGQTVWRGDVDRFSGLAIVSVWRNREVLVNYNLTCRRPEPLF